MFKRVWEIKGVSIEVGLKEGKPPTNHKNLRAVFITFHVEISRVIARIRRKDATHTNY